MKGKLIKENNGYTLFVDGKVFGDTDGNQLKSITNRLSIKNCQAIERGYDLDELANKSNGYLYYDSKKENKALAFDDGFKSGFQKALELMGDKKFSENDLLQAIEMYYGEGKTFIEIIQSLQQTEWDVKIEMEYVGECNGNNDNGCFQDSPGHNCGCFERKPKLDATGCLILKRL